MVDADRAGGERVIAQFPCPREIHRQMRFFLRVLLGASAKRKGSGIILWWLLKEKRPTTRARSAALEVVLLELVAHREHLHTTHRLDFVQRHVTRRAGWYHSSRRVVRLPCPALRQDQGAAES